MSITNQEITSIIAITQQYLAPETVAELFTKINDEVGKNSKNDFLKKLLFDIKELVNPPIPTPPLWLKPAFITLVIAHWLLVVAFASSFIILPFSAPWYIALPLMTFMFFFTTTRVECQLTKLENYWRKKLGMKKIGGFVGHYFMRPIKNKILKKIFA